MTKDPVFGFDVPTACPGVDGQYLCPRESWGEPEAYDKAAAHLAGLFRENFRQFEAVAADVLSGGPPDVAVQQSVARRATA